MKVIFLDIDGVLNTNDTYDRVDNEYQVMKGLKIYIDEFRVEYLRRIVKRTGAKIVLSSSLRWRFKKIGDKCVPLTHNFAPNFIDILGKYDLSLYDVTPNIINIDGQLVKRQDEIKLWLFQNSNVESFVILDDETTELMDFVGSSLIILNNLPIGEMVCGMKDSIGLCEEHIEKAVDILNCKSYCKKRIRCIGDKIREV